MLNPDEDVLEIWYAQHYRVALVASQTVFHNAAPYTGPNDDLIYHLWSVDDLKACASSYGWAVGFAIRGVNYLGKLM